MTEPTGASAEWLVQKVTGTVAQLHEREAPSEARPTVWLMDPTNEALVLGSAQRKVAVDELGLAAGGLALVRRSSGGGAVIINGFTGWVDVWLPQDSPLWTTDLGETFLLVGRAWVQALAGLGVTAELFTQRPERSEVADAVCFAGLGWGEVTVDGVKVVGLSQRRTRWGARVQCMVVAADHTRAVAALLGVDPQRLPPVMAASGWDLAALQQSFVDHLTAG